MSVLDFVFGKSALKKAAGAVTPKPKVPSAGLDIAGDAAKMAAAPAPAPKSIMGKIGSGVVDYEKAKLKKKKQQLQEGAAGRIGATMMGRGNYGDE